MLWLLVTFGGAKGNSAIILDAMTPLNGLREETVLNTAVQVGARGEKTMGGTSGEKTSFGVSFSVLGEGRSGTRRDGTMLLSPLPSSPLPLVGRWFWGSRE